MGICVCLTRLGKFHTWEKVNIGLSGQNFCFTVLSIHKRPVVGHADISFPMKGWRGMVDWARSSEDKVIIPKNILATDKSGERSCMTYPITSHLNLHLQ